jgi:hypothetical protein
LSQSAHGFSGIETNGVRKRQKFGHVATLIPAFNIGNVGLTPSQSLSNLLLREARRFTLGYQ